VIRDGIGWRSFADINTSEGALPYEQMTGGADYVGFLASAAIRAGAGRCGPIGQGSGSVIEAAPLVADAVARIEAAFGA
jgi:hypothetical protein